MKTRPAKSVKRRASMTAEDLERLRSSPAEFRTKLRIDTDEGPRRLDELLDPWQRADFEALDQGWRRVARQPVEGTPKNRAWFERPRGHSKTADIAVQVSWVLFASRRQLTGVVGAADKEQARLLRTAIQKLVRLNPWLKSFLHVQRHRVVNPFTGSELLILSSDAESTYGQTPDFVICDELTHWPGEKGQKFWTALFSAAAKRKHCMLVVITNAGVGAGQLWPDSQKDKKASWQWKAREAARCLPQWHFSRLDGPKASWIAADDLIEQEAMLPPAAYRRLWLNVWVTGGGDALDPNDIQACITLDGPTFAPQPGYLYLGGLDLGVKHDHSAWILVGVKPGTGRVRVVLRLSSRPLHHACPPSGGVV
jgi:phage terminase large subunit-like protein